MIRKIYLENEVGMFTYNYDIEFMSPSGLGMEVSADGSLWSNPSNKPDKNQTISLTAYFGLNYKDGYNAFNLFGSSFVGEYLKLHYEFGIDGNTFHYIRFVNLTSISKTEIKYNNSSPEGGGIIEESISLTPYTPWLVDTEAVQISTIDSRYKYYHSVGYLHSYEYIGEVATSPYGTGIVYSIPKHMLLTGYFILIKIPHVDRPIKIDIGGKTLITKSGFRDVTLFISPYHIMAIENNTNSYYDKILDFWDSSSEVPPEDYFHSVFVYYNDGTAREVDCTIELYRGVPIC